MMSGEWLIAAVGGGWYGLPVGSVGEVVEIPQPTRIPLAPDFVRGVVSNKGEILPVIDASMILTDRVGPPADIAVVVRHRDTDFGLLVEGISGIRGIPAEQIARSSGSGYRERFFAGTVRADGILLTLLDLDGLVPFIASSLEAIASEGVLK
jgi:purine-binding chemotaxis protein CheW